MKKCNIMKRILNISICLVLSCCMGIQLLANNMILKATSQDQNNTNSYLVSVVGGIGMRESSSPFTSEKITVGEKIVVHFDSTLPEGKVFKQWVVTKGNVKLQDPTSSDNCSFIMPAEEVEVSAETTDGKKITVENTTLYGEHVNGNYAAPGSDVFLYYSTFAVPENMVFKQWVVKKGNVVLDNPQDMQGCRFTMPNEDVEFEAEFATGYRIIMDQPFIYANKGNLHAEGSNISLGINVSKIPEGKTFKRWVVKKGNVVLNKPESWYECTFTMPAEDVEIDVEFVDGKKVTVEYGSVPSMNINTLFEPGKTIKLSYDSYLAPKGKIFKQWIVKKGNVTLMNPTSKHDCQFIMPNEDVEISVEFADGYSVDIVDGTTNIYEPYIKSGTRVNVVHDHAKTPKGKIFKRWVVKQGNITLQNPEDPYNCSFVMSAENVILEPEYVAGKAIEVVRGGADGTYCTNGYALPGFEVTIYFNGQDLPEGKVFGKWKVVKGNVKLSDPQNPNFCKFIMPDEEVKIEAEIVDGYKITISNGSADCGEYARAGQFVRLTFDINSVPEKMIFDRWVSKNESVKLLDATNSYNCFFKMPNENVVIEALLVEGKKITVENGGFYGKGIHNSYAAPGSMILLRYNSQNVPEGNVFSRWRVVKGNVELIGENLEDDCRFYMFNEDVEIVADYEKGYPIQVIDGVSSQRNYAKAGNRISLVHDRNKTPTGKVFKRWVVKEGNVTLDFEDRQNNCSFTMPKEKVVIEPEYEDGVKVTLINGQLDEMPAGDGYLKANSVYKLSITTPSAGKAFKRWKVVKGNAELLNPYEMEHCSFICPNEDVTIEAEFGDGYQVSIKDASFGYWNISCYNPGDTVFFQHKQQHNSNQILAGWNVVSGNVTIENGSDYKIGKFIMPSEDVVIEPIYKEGNYVRVNDGNSIIDSYHLPGQKVHLRFQRIDIYDQFLDHWKVVSGNVEIHCPSSEQNAWFTMPEGDVEIEAVLKQSYHANVMYKGNQIDLITYPGDCEITLPKTNNVLGKQIVGWKCKDPTIKISKNEFGEFKVRVPKENIEFEAIVTDDYNLDVEGGQYALLDTMEIIPKTKIVPGTIIRLIPRIDTRNKEYIFKEWKVIKGNVKLSNPKSMNCSFVMPSEDVKIKAVFQKGIRVVITDGTILDSKYKQSQIEYMNKGETVYFTLLNDKQSKNQAIDHWISEVPIHKSSYGNDIYYFVMPDHDIIIKAAYTKDICNINIDANKGSVNPMKNSFTCKKGEDFILPLPDVLVHNDNQEFKAWEIDGKEYQALDHVRVNHDITLKAIWIKRDEAKYHAVFSPKVVSMATNVLPNSEIEYNMIKEGNTVILNANKVKNTLKVAEKDVQLTYDEEQNIYTFTMPNHPVHIYPTLDHRVIVMYDFNGGMVDSEMYLEPFYPEYPVMGLMLAPMPGPNPGPISPTNPYLMDQNFRTRLANGMYDAVVMNDDQVRMQVFSEIDDPLKHPDGKQFEGWYCDGKIYQTDADYMITKDAVFVAVWSTAKERDTIKEFNTLVQSLKTKEEIRHARSLYDSLSYYVKHLVPAENLALLEQAEKGDDQDQKPTIVPKGFSISLKNRISLNIYLEMNEEMLKDQNAYIEMSVMDADKQITKKVMLHELEKVNQQYRISFPLNVRAMNDEVTMTIYTTGKDGHLCASKEEKYSIVMYANSLLEQSDQLDANVIAVVEAMLNYGAVAQQYFDYKVDQLANANVVNKEYQNVDASAFEAYKPQIDGTITGMAYGASNLRLLPEAAIRHHFVINEDMKQSYQDGNLTFTLLNEQGEAVKTLSPTFYDENKAYVEITNIFAEDLHKAYRVQVKNTTNNEEITISYSVFSYGYTAMNHSSAKQETKDIVKAMYVYNQAALNYKNMKEQ